MVWQIGGRYLLPAICRDPVDEEALQVLHCQRVPIILWPACDENRAILWTLWANVSGTSNILIIGAHHIEWCADTRLELNESLRQVHLSANPLLHEELTRIESRFSKMSTQSAKSGALCESNQ